MLDYDIATIRFENCVDRLRDFKEKLDIDKLKDLNYNFENFVNKLVEGEKNKC